eukprot:COSAG05_NODE_23964_length_254_cov_1.322581_1_plen_45_part_10
MNKKINVQKYGGTSVGSTERINAIADRLIKLKSHNQDDHFVVVVS